MVDTKAHWENIYQDKSPLEVSWHQEQPTLSLELIRNTLVGYDEPIIDVGGGASLLVDYLYKEGFSNIAVLDISSKALSCAKERFEVGASQIEWYEADVTQFEAPHPFALWHDRAVFHFLTEKSDRKKYIQALQKSLLPGGHLVIASFAIGGPTKCSGLDVVQYDAKKLQSELPDTFRLVEEKFELHLTPAGKEQKFMYFRFIKRDGFHENEY